MFHSDKYQQNWPATPKPSAIDGLIAQKPIGKMTADEYAVLVRRAQVALREASPKPSKPTRRRSVA